MTEAVMLCHMNYNSNAGDNDFDINDLE